MIYVQMQTWQFSSLLYRTSCACLFPLCIAISLLMFAPLKQSLQARGAVSSFQFAWCKLLLPAAKASGGPMPVDRICASSTGSQSRQIHSANPCHAWDGTARLLQRGDLRTSTVQLVNVDVIAGLGTQEELMAKDQCILVTEADEICGHASKYDAHRFNKQQPQGLLHRAFSVFLFNSKNKLLLQQRAPGKITFPSVWTNTCCSHPLYGQDPPEVDSPAAIGSGTVEVRPADEYGVRPDPQPAVPIASMPMAAGSQDCSRQEAAARAGHPAESATY